MSYATGTVHPRCSDNWWTVSPGTHWWWEDSSALPIISAAGVLWSTLPVRLNSCLFRPDRNWRSLRRRYDRPRTADFRNDRRSSWCSFHRGWSASRAWSAVRRNMFGICRKVSLLKKQNSCSADFRLGNERYRWKIVTFRDNDDDDEDDAYNDNDNDTDNGNENYIQR